MPRPLRPVLLLLLALLLAVLPGCGGERGANRAPDFEATTLDGEIFRLSDHRGEVVVLNFWATWCVPCLAEMPEFVRLQEELRDEGVLFVGVSQDRGGEAEIRPFAERLAINYPLIPDPDYGISAAYGDVPYLPTTFVIDREGRIHRSQVGQLSRSYLLMMLQDLVDLEAAQNPSLVPAPDADTTAEPLPVRLLPAHEAQALAAVGAMVVDVLAEADTLDRSDVFAIALADFGRDDLPADLSDPLIFIGPEAEAGAARAAAWGYANVYRVEEPLVLPDAAEQEPEPPLARAPGTVAG